MIRRVLIYVVQLRIISTTHCVPRSGSCNVYDGNRSEKSRKRLSPASNRSAFGAGSGLTDSASKDLPKPHGEVDD